MVQAPNINRAQLFLETSTMTITKPNAQSIYESLKRMIIEFQIAPGSRITEAQVAEYFQVSRTPVRAALQRLETEGQLEIKSKQGCFIRNIDIQTISNYYDVRIELEKMTVKTVANLIKVNDDAKQELIALRDRWELEKRYYGIKITEKLKLAEEQFHIDLAEISGNQVLVKYLHDVNNHIRLVRQLGWPDQKSLEDTYNEHYLVCNLILRGHVTKAIDEMTHHIRKSQDLAERVSLKQIYSKKKQVFN